MNRVSTTASTVLRQHLAAVRVLLLLTIVLGIAYPLVVLGIGHVAFVDGANGSIVHSGGRAVGSALIGQNFTDAKGKPLPQWFQPRPSSAGNTGYDPMASSASNLGPNSTELVKSVTERRRNVAAFDSVPGHRVRVGQVPADAVTASGSGLDPQISPANARLQTNRVARARGLDVRQVEALVTDHTQGRTIGILGEPRVNVLELNMALMRLPR